MSFHLRPLIYSLTLFTFVYENWNLTYTTKHDSRVHCLAQAGLAAFGKASHQSSYAKAEQLSRRTSQSGIRATSR